MFPKKKQNQKLWGTKDVEERAYSYLFWLNDPCFHAHEQRAAAAAAALHPRHQVGFSPPAVVCALPCVLSTITGLSCLSAKRQKCCAATLLSAVWLCVAEHLRVPPLTD